jgi:hypothetical protein
MWQAGFLSVVAWHYVYGMKEAGLKTISYHLTAVQYIIYNLELKIVLTLH